MIFKLSIYVTLYLFSTVAVAKVRECARLFDTEVSIAYELQNSKIIGTRKGPAATEEGYILTLEGGRKAFFKPIDMKAESQRLIGYQSPSNEIVAYHISELFGFRVVPPTVLRTVSSRPGSVQLYVEGKTPYQIEKKTSVYIYESDLIWLFDKLIGNIDRTDRNYIIQKNGNQWAIDNAASFFLQKNNLHENFSNNPEVILKIKRIAIEHPHVIEALKNLSDKEITLALKHELKPVQIRQMLDRRRTLLILIEESLRANP